MFFEKLVNVITGIELIVAFAAAEFNLAIVARSIQSN